MKSIFKYLKEFFEPEFIEYEIMQSQQKVLDSLEQAFNLKTENPDTKGLRGILNGNEFTMGLISGGNEALYSAALQGKVLEKRAETCKLEVFIVRNSTTYLTFFLSVIAAIVYLVMYFNNPASKKLLFWSFGILTLGVIYSIWFSNNSSKKVKKQLEIFLEENNLFY